MKQNKQTMQSTGNGSLLQQPCFKVNQNRKFFYTQHANCGTKFPNKINTNNYKILNIFKIVRLADMVVYQIFGFSGRSPVFILSKIKISLKQTNQRL